MNLKYFFLILAILPACVGPKYKRPTHKMPAQFKHACENVTEKQPLIHWWKQFEDPTLNKLIDYALDCNYDLQIALEKIEESRALYQFKNAQLFPEIDVIGEARRTRFSKAVQQNSFLTKTNLSFFEFGFDGFWEIDIWGKIRHARNAQYFAFQAQIEQMRDVLIMLIAEVANKYIILCSLNEQVKLTKEKIIIEERLVSLQKDLYASGLVSQIELAQQEQTLATTRDLLEQLIIAHAQTHHQLAILLGLNPEQFKIRTPRTTVPLSDYPITTGIPSNLLRRRPDIRQAERTVASTNESIGAAIAEWFPQFTLFGGVSTQASKAENLFANNSLAWSIGPSVRWPIINFGRIRANINVQKSINKQAILSYSNTIINALKDVEDFLVAYCHSKEQRKILEQKYDYASEQEQLIGAKYTAGLANELMSLNAQQNSLSVALEVVAIRQAYSTNLVGLYKALGGGW